MLSKLSSLELNETLKKYLPKYISLVEVPFEKIARNSSELDWCLSGAYHIHKLINERIQEIEKEELREWAPDNLSEEEELPAFASDRDSTETKFNEEFAKLNSDKEILNALNQRNFNPPTTNKGMGFYDFANHNDAMKVFLALKNEKIISDKKNPPQKIRNKSILSLSTNEKIKFDDYLAKLKLNDNNLRGAGPLYFGAGPGVMRGENLASRNIPKSVKVDQLKELINNLESNNKFKPAVKKPDNTFTMASYSFNSLDSAVEFYKLLLDLDIITASKKKPISNTVSLGDGELKKLRDLTSKSTPRPGQ